MFIIKDKIGKWAVTVWTAMWFLTQFASHELVTLTGNGYENMSSYFEGALKWLDIEGVYVPDIYHTILHILILVVLINGIAYILRERRIKN